MLQIARLSTRRLSAAAGNCPGDHCYPRRRQAPGDLIGRSKPISNRLRPVSQFNYLPRVMEAISLIARGYSVTRACKTAQVSPSVLYSARRRFDEVDAAYHEAQTRACDALVDIRDHELYGSEDSREQRVLSDNIKWILARKDRARFGPQTSTLHIKSDKSESSQTIIEALQRAEQRVRAEITGEEGQSSP